MEGCFREEGLCLYNRWKSRAPWHFCIRLELHTLEGRCLRGYTTAVSNFHLLHFSPLKVDILVQDFLWPLIILVDSEKTLNGGKTGLCAEDTLSKNRVNVQTSFVSISQAFMFLTNCAWRRNGSL